MVDATGLLVLPGVVDVHTHTRVASDAEPDRFFQDSVAAAFGGTTTFLSFNNPGTGSSPAAERSLRTGLAEWRAATDGDSAIDVGLSLAVSGHADDPLAELPATIDAGVATSKAFMVFDFRLADRALFDAMRVMGERGAMLQVHCEDPVLLDAGRRGLPRARRDRAAVPRRRRGRRTSRPWRPPGPSPSPGRPGRRSTSSTCRRRRPSTRSARGKAAGVRVTAETCPHYLVLTEERYAEPDPARCACFVISPPLRSAADREALWAGLADGTLDLVATDHVPDRLAVEKAEAAAGVSFDRISNGAPGIETLLATRLQRGRRPRARSPSSGWSTCWPRPRRARFGLSRKGEPSRSAGTPTSWCSTRRPRGTLRAADLHHTSDYTPYEGLAVEGAVRDVVRARDGRHPRRAVRRPARASAGSSSVGPSPGERSVTGSRTSVPMRPTPRSPMPHPGPGSTAWCAARPHRWTGARPSGGGDRSRPDG